ncbi:sulfurtransferase-like selenium metabolism protein YedF [Marinilabilia rubra]|uniref:Sulfurtransferase-like selenium metabolism protein YedF n=1 Tax=Marinilabilia rubra TaxID=2162893 RepID=A0A2U2B4V6_9BACT|nr:sulfurtransferase-like selenium metabolism protein YedF [Marinilabilia rubra]PWD98111.1 sulfurtransferase-like selenium metabolism protein YedF [Marinilabilia rubra]
MHTVDTKGHLCPEPLIMARNAMKEVKEGEKMLVISDNETSYQNLMSFLSDLGANPVADQKEGQYFIEITKPAETSSGKEGNPEAYCNIPHNMPEDSNYVVVARGANMGEGDEELGSLLIRGYFNALKGMDNLPTHIIMYNGGVKLALKDTDTSESLAELEDKGVSIIVCGTCIDYYQIKEKVSVGRISNMYQIATKLAEAGHVVYL